MEGLDQLKKSNDLIGNRNSDLPACSIVHQPTTLQRGSKIAQAVIRWLPTAAARVRSRVWSSGICGGQSGAGEGFSPSTSISPANLHSTKFSIVTITRGRYNRPEVADVPGGPSIDSTPPPRRPLTIKLISKFIIFLINSSW
jgi:hypothetical protein